MREVAGGRRDVGESSRLALQQVGQFGLECVVDDDDDGDDGDWTCGTAITATFASSSAPYISSRSGVMIIRILSIGVGAPAI